MSFVEKLKSADTAAQSGRAAAAAVIASFGDRAMLRVPAAANMLFGHWQQWPDWLTEGTDLPRSEPLPARITLADDLIILGNIVDHADGCALLHRILTIPRTILGPMGTTLLLQAPNLAAALDALTTALTAQNPYLRAEFSVAEEGGIVKFSHTIPEGDFADFVILTAIAVMLRAVEALAVDSSGPLVVESCSGASQYAAPVQDYLAGALRHTEVGHRLIIPGAWLGYSNPEHDKILWQAARERVDAIRRQFEDPPLVTQIRTRIAETLSTEQRVPRLKQVSVDLVISSRTIVRTLSANATSFHRLIDEERRIRALPLLMDATRSLNEIAAMLGFSDNTSFGRSFRRWFGEAPGQMRRRALFADDLD